MSDRICSICRGATATGCEFCNPTLGGDEMSEVTIPDDVKRDPVRDAFLIRQADQLKAQRERNSELDRTVANQYNTIAELEAEVTEMENILETSIPSKVRKLEAQIGYVRNCRDRLRREHTALEDELRNPTKEMLEAARDWSHKKYGKPIGNDAARGCLNAMTSALLDSINNPNFDSKVSTLIDKESESKCEHGNGLTDFCEPCGRTHGGGGDGI